MKRTDFALILARNFTLSPFALFLDTLRLAGDEGDHSGRVHYDWQVLDTVGLPIRSSCGVEVLPTARLAHPDAYDHIVVCGGLLHRGVDIDAATAEFLRAAAARGVRIAALCTGSFVLAELGLLDGYRVCVSWFHHAEFKAAFPAIDCTSEPLFLIDRDRATCPGGAGAADFAAQLVRRDLGRAPARKASHILLFERARDQADRQPRGGIDLDLRRPQVRQALALMEDDLERRLSVAEIADRVGCSTRQLERLFFEETGRGPQSFYRALRLGRAHHLITSTDRSLIAIAAELGFTSAAHFGRAFRREYGVAPSSLRRTPPPST